MIFRINSISNAPTTACSKIELTDIDLHQLRFISNESVERHEKFISLNRCTDYLFKKVQDVLIISKSGFDFFVNVSTCNQTIFT